MAEGSRHGDPGTHLEDDSPIPPAKSAKEEFLLHGRVEDASERVQALERAGEWDDFPEEVAEHDTPCGSAPCRGDTAYMPSACVVAA